VICVAVKVADSISLEINTLQIHSRPRLTGLFHNLETTQRMSSPLRERGAELYIKPTTASPAPRFVVRRAAVSISIRRPIADKLTSMNGREVKIGPKIVDESVNEIESPTNQACFGEVELIRSVLSMSVDERLAALQDFVDTFWTPPHG
jgi:hypothetical protein